MSLQLEIRPPFCHQLSVTVPTYPPAADASGLSFSRAIGECCGSKRRRCSEDPVMLRDFTAKVEPALDPGASSLDQVPLTTTTPKMAPKLQSLAAKRESLRLNFHRSISDPHSGGLALTGFHQPPSSELVLSPPSCSPSLHPSKRCKMMLIQDAASKSKHSPTWNGDTSSGRPVDGESDGDSLPKSICPSDAAPCTSGPDHLLPPRSIATGSVSLPTSPCSESSTLQRTLLLKNAKTIDPKSLAAKLEPSSLAGKKGGSYPFVLVDCRPFIVYNVNHIRGAINVNCCDRFNRKRLQQRKASLADLATTKEGKELLKKRTWREVVVYDDCSENLENLPASHTLFLVMNALVEDRREPIMLLGGLRDFQVDHKFLCEDHLMQTSSSSSPVMRTFDGRIGDDPRLPSCSSRSAFLPELPSPTEICDTKDIENHPATEVLPHLFLGNMKDASDVKALHSLGVQYVLNITAKPPCYMMDPNICYKQLVAADNGLQNLRQFFDEAFEFIDLAKSNHSGVLVHCQAGISRSPTIAVAYLMKHYPMSMAEAYKFVKRRRTIISPNLNFMGQLWEFEQGLRDDMKRSTSASSSNTLTDSGIEMVASTSSSSSSSSLSPTFSSSLEPILTLTAADEGVVAVNPKGSDGREVGVASKKINVSLAQVIETACCSKTNESKSLWSEHTESSSHRLESIPDTKGCGI